MISDVLASAKEKMAQSIEVAKGDTVRIVVSSDVEDEIHLHGYDITRNVAPGSRARFSFAANAEPRYFMMRTPRSAMRSMM